MTETATTTTPTKSNDDFSTFRQYEFGGPLGAAFIMLFSHVAVYYLWISVTYYAGALIYPSGIGDIGPWFGRMFGHFVDGALPTWKAAAFYLGFIGLQALFAYTLPGVRAVGLPVPSLGGKVLEYKCNGVASWYATLALAAVLHFTGILRLSFLVDNLGPLLTVSVIFGNLLAVWSYVEAKRLGATHRASGNFIYDFFMGIHLNPRVGTLDVKMFAEIRISWILLFLLTLSAAVKQYELLHTVTPGMLVMVLAHLLYANACQKGEECIPQTWDFFYENFGWYLAFWNCAGVAFTYSFQSIYILKHGPAAQPTWYFAGVVVALLFAYYVWDTSQSQKNRFRMKLAGTYIPRRTFPQLPWGTLENPRYIVTKSGSTLLTDGWYRYARKIHYTADIVMALCWGLACGFDNFLPYYYVCFFTVMITHRYFRDKAKMERKYGEDYKRYCEEVPYVFVPYVF
jgi:delta24(24(1))-sterol reductase